MPTFLTFDLEITLTEPMLGTVPKNKDVYTDFIATRAAKRKTGVVADVMDADIEDEIDSVPVDDVRGWTGFHTDDDGIFIYDYMVKGFLKEAGNVLKGELKLAALKSKIDSYLFVFPRKLRIRKLVQDNPGQHLEVMQGPDSDFERPLRAITMQGPRVTLVRSDLVDAGSVIHCELRLLAHGELKEPVLRQLLEYGQYQGLGQFRNGSFGRFEYTMTLRNP